MAQSFSRSAAPVPLPALLVWGLEVPSLPVAPPEAAAHRDRWSCGSPPDGDAKAGEKVPLVRAGRSNRAQSGCRRSDFDKGFSVQYPRRGAMGEKNAVNKEEVARLRHLDPMGSAAV